MAMPAAATPSRHEPRRGPRDWLCWLSPDSTLSDSLSVHGTLAPPSRQTPNGAREKVVHTQHTRLPRQPRRSFFTANEGMHYVYSAHLAFVQHAPGTRAAHR